MLIICGALDLRFGTWIQHDVSTLKIDGCVENATAIFWILARLVCGEPIFVWITSFEHNFYQMLSFKFAVCKLLRGSQWIPANVWEIQTLRIFFAVSVFKTRNHVRKSFNFLLRCHNAWRNEQCWDTISSFIHEHISAIISDPCMCFLEKLVHFSLFNSPPVIFLLKCSLFII